MNINFDQIRQEKLASMYEDLRIFEYKKLLKSIQRFDDLKSSFKIFVEHHQKHFANFDFGENALDKFYESHLFRVCRLVADNLSIDNIDAENTLKVAFLHNAIEKKYMTKKEIETDTNAWVSEGIEALTFNRKETNNVCYLNTYYSKLRSLPQEIMLVKICDKFDNLPAQCIKKDHKQRTEYFDEIRAYILPSLPCYSKQLETTFRAVLDNAEEVGFINASH